MVWAWLPAQEYAELTERWPDLTDSDLVRDEQTGGLVSHAVYCRRMDSRLREAAEAGVSRLHVAPLHASEFARWVAEHGAGERDAAQLRARYAADLGRDRSRVIRWPPGRNEPCWCGSGRQYKKCCRSTAARAGVAVKTLRLRVTMREVRAQGRSG